MKPLDDYTPEEWERMAQLLHDEIEYGLNESIKEAMRAGYRLMMAKVQEKEVEILKREVHR